MVRTYPGPLSHHNLLLDNNIRSATPDHNSFIDNNTRSAPPDHNCLIDNNRRGLLLDDNPRLLLDHDTGRLMDIDSGPGGILRGVRAWGRGLSTSMLAN